jgi:riboflavin kinase/FMN adenylyltransferase
VIVLTGHPFEWDVASPTAVTIGVFDGVHVGHQRVLSDLVDEATRAALTPAVLTFDPHPLSIVAPEKAPLMLTSLSQRLDQFRLLGVELVGVLFFPDIREMTAHDFARQVLAGVLQSRRVVVGADFRFGRDRTGDAQLLGMDGPRLGFQVSVVDMFGHLNGVVSSTRIRRLLATGDVEQAAMLLARPYELTGRVVHGSHRGQSIGFPTANIEVPAGRLVPGDGVYAGITRLEGHRGPAVANIGHRPTFGGTGRTIEIHLLDFDSDLYGRELAFAFRSRIRQEVRFDSVDQLARQIKDDVARARLLLGG